MSSLPQDSERPADLAPGLKTFAANRATGGVMLRVRADGRRTRRSQIHEHGSLRARFPNASEDLLEAVIINTAGGMTGGDNFSIQIALGPGSKILAGTAAAEKIYRSTGPDATVALSIDAASGSRCFWLPQETILFNRARLSRRVDINLADDASLVMAEAIVFGRAAMGEAVSEGRLFDRWRVRRANQLIFAESIRLEGAIAEKLGRPAIAAGAIAIATILIVPGDDAKVMTVRALANRFIGEVGISSWNGIALARLCAHEDDALRRDLRMLLTSLGTPVPRLWLQ